MGITLRNVFTKFTAGEAERITGVSAATQRDWRRRGYLPAGRDGWTQYDIGELAKLLTMGALQDRGIGPSVSEGIATSAALRIMSHALSWPDAIEDQTGGDLERVSRKLKISRAEHFVGSTSGAHTQRFLVVWADGNMVLTSHLEKAFGGSSSDNRYRGATIVLDLEALGSLMVERAGRPLVTVESHDDDK